MTFSNDPNFTYDFLAYRFLKVEMSKKEIFLHKGHLRDQYRNHRQNLMLDTAIEIVETQKPLFGIATEEFAQAFKAQTGKIVEA